MTDTKMTQRKATLLQELRVKCLVFEAAMQLVTHPEAERESVEVHNQRIHRAYTEIGEWVDEIRKLDQLGEDPEQAGPDLPA